MVVVLKANAAGGSGTGGADAMNVRGSTTGLAPLAIATLVTYTVAFSKLRGFIVHGDTDAEVWVEVDNVPLAGIRARHSRVLPAYVVLPNPEPYASPTAVVSLKVQNMGQTAGDFEGTLLGE